MKFIASPNFNERSAKTSLQYIILHYTAMDTAEDAIKRLCNPKYEVSAHYLIDKNGNLIQMVDESLRAWHAGEASWQGQKDINSRSIGIELDNNGEEAFPEQQISSLETLIQSIMSRHNLKADCVLGHSDIAPSRKQDPGAFFPWERLAEKGLCVLTATRKREYDEFK